MAPPTIDRMSYSDAIHYYLTHPIAGSRTSNGAMILRPEGQSHIFTQAFVDDDWIVLQDSDGRPVGRKVKVLTVEDDLADAFAGKEVLIVPGVSRLLTTQSACDFLRYDEVVDYFRSNLPGYTGAIAGALIIRRTAPNGYDFQQIFLDSNERLICAPGGQPQGRQFAAARIDAQLEQAIGGTKDVLIFKDLRQQEMRNVESSNGQSNESDSRNRHPRTPQQPLTPAQTAKSKPPRFRFPRARRLLSYREVVEYFVTQRPAHRDICKGALLVRREGANYAIEQTFLDKQGEPVVDRTGKPIGRKIVVTELDAELREVVGTNQVVIFE